MTQEKNWLEKLILSVMGALILTLGAFLIDVKVKLAVIEKDDERVIKLEETDKKFWQRFKDIRTAINVNRDIMNKEHVADRLPNFEYTGTDQ